MRLKTKLVLAMTALTFGVVLVLSILFLGELLRQRVAQTAATNDVLAREVLLNIRQALLNGLREHPPEDGSDEAFQRAVADALRSYEPLSDEMNAIVRYSPTVQDVSISNAHGMVLVSTDPSLHNQHLPYRTPFSKTHDGGVLEEARAVFGHPQVLDLSLALDRNGQAFLSVHIGIRSTFLRNSYAPWLQAAILFSGFAMLGCIVVAALLSNLALRPIETISQRLEQLSLSAGGPAEGLLLEADTSTSSGSPDPLQRASKSIERLGEKIRTSEQVYTTLQSNLNQMLDALRDGVILFTADTRAIMVSEAVQGFLNRERDQILGLTAEQIFDRHTALGRAVREAFITRTNALEEKILTENGREIQMSIEFLHDDGEGMRLGALLTLHDAESAEQLEREIEISRRLAAIGRLTSGVSHEVKNPINAMVLHLELLRNKLAANGDGCNGAQKHVDILSSEMQRLDRVVQQLADFSRPVDLKLTEHDMRRMVQAVIDLTAVSAEQQQIRIESLLPNGSLPVRIDEDLLRQALLNVLINATQAMPDGGILRVTLERSGQAAILRIMDTGPGIPAELLTKVFDLYFTTKPKGSGIGLAMTYRIVQLHGGSIDVRSITDTDSPEQGTTFTVTLPLDLSANARRLSLPSKETA